MNINPSMFYMFYYISFIAWLLIGIGVLALLTNLGLISSSIWVWWPVLLVVVGIFILIVKKKRKKIVLHGILRRLATDDRVQDKLKKIVETVDELVEKKIDDWHKEVVEKKDEGTGRE